MRKFRSLDHHIGCRPGQSRAEAHQVADYRVRPGLAELVGEDEYQAAEGEQEADDLAPRYPLAEEEMTADQHPERHSVDEKRAAGDRGVVQPGEDQQKFEPEEQAGQQAGPQRAVALKKLDAAPPAPEKHQRTAERRADEGEEDRTV